MNEAELAQQKIAELQAQLNVYKRQEEHLIPLPNGDLHRGFRKFAPEANIDVDFVPDSMGNPLDRAMAKILANKRIDQSTLSCLWCGLQFDAMGAENTLRDHLKKDHPSVVEGYDKIVPEVLMANIAEMKTELGKKK